MKKIAAIFLALILIPGITSAAPETVAGSRVYVVSGQVFVTQGKNPAHQVAGSEAIVSDTLVNTGDNSSALLKFEDGQVVTMQANSAFRVRSYRYDVKKVENSNILFSVLKGGMRFITGLIGQQSKQSFRLLTPNATIGVRGTDFMVAMQGNTMYSQVLTGNIGMTNATGMALLGAGQAAVVPSSGALVSLIASTKVPTGTFAELLSIPTNPAAISATTPTPSTPAPTASLPVPPVPVVAPVAAASAAGAGAVSAGAAVASGALSAVVGDDTKSAPADTAAAPAVESAPVEPPQASPPAEESGAAIPATKSGKAITVKVGTLGYGIEYNMAISERVTARFGLNAFTYNYNSTASTVNYDFKLKLQTVSAIADWYPFAEGLRASTGVFYNNNKATLDALPDAGGNFTINGNSVSGVDKLQGTITFNKLAPYLGVGWGNAVAKDKGWGFAFDIGALFQNKPKTNLTATCRDPQLCATIQPDLAAENAKLQNDLAGFRWWPVLSIGASYQW